MWVLQDFLFKACLVISGEERIRFPTIIRQDSRATIVILLLHSFLPCNITRSRHKRRLYMIRFSGHCHFGSHAEDLDRLVSTYSRP